MKNSIVSTKTKAVKNLIVGDKVLSFSGRQMKVSCIKNTENKTIVLFDGDLEIDFDPYFQIKTIEKE